MWIVEKYLRWGILVVILWVILFFGSRYGCSSVRSAQMEPYLSSESFIIVHVKQRNPNQISSQQDILQFEYGMAKERKYVARVIGLPGDRIRIDKGKVFRTARGSGREEPLSEQYLKLDALSLPTEEYEEIIVPRGCYWLMGDNRRREADKDSRAFGPISVLAVDGTVGKMPLTN
jgi:signal peptidase I